MKIGDHLQVNLRKSASHIYTSNHPKSTPAL